MSKTRQQLSLFAMIGPGILVAATGVGAGDLATAALTGSRLGITVLWAVVVGGLFKFVLTEGLTRFQLATGRTLLEGVADQLGRRALWIFWPYLFLWSFLVSAALMSATGATIQALLPLFEEPAQGKVIYGALAGVIALLLVRRGSFDLFEKIMGLLVGMMFLVVLITAASLSPEPAQILTGLMTPSIPESGGGGITWTIALIGGVGGTLTILCYGYWIRARGRTTLADLQLCRVDLGVGYSVTVIFGLCMVVIGSTIQLEGRGAGLLIALGERLAESHGSGGRIIFLIGAWGAIFSSLLGVWQAVPYLFADSWELFINRRRNGATGDLTLTPAYRYFQLALVLIPITGLFISFSEVQKLYAVFGALFIPLLALVLLFLNGKKSLVATHTNRPLTVFTLLTVLAFFLLLAGMKLIS